MTLRRNMLQSPVKTDVSGLFMRYACAAASSSSMAHLLSDIPASRRPSDKPNKQNKTKRIHFFKYFKNIQTKLDKTGGF